jgi:hypothetical protein
MSAADELRAAARELRKQADGGFHPLLANALDSHALSHQTNDCNFSHGSCEMLTLAHAIKVVTS